MTRLVLASLPAPFCSTRAASLKTIVRPSSLAVESFVKSCVRDRGCGSLWRGSLQAPPVSSPGSRPARATVVVTTCSWVRGTRGGEAAPCPQGHPARAPAGHSDAFRAPGPSFSSALPTLASGPSAIRGSGASAHPLLGGLLARVSPRLTLPHFHLLRCVPPPLTTPGTKPPLRVTTRLAEHKRVSEGT